MATPAWQPGALYPPGSLVVPRSAPPSTLGAITNPGFESGSTGWTLDTGITVSNSRKYTGSYAAKVSGSVGIKRATNTAVACAAGATVSGSCYYDQGHADAGDNAGRVFLQFFDSSDVSLGRKYGNAVVSSNGGWQRSTVSAQAPAFTAKVAIGCEVDFTDDAGGHECYFDDFSWSLTDASSSTGLQYKAVQTNAGYSDDVEPAWPSSLGVTVVDNEVTWEAVSMSRIVWKARALLVSGATEPDWPTTSGGEVADGPISWKATSRRVEDEKCPQSKYVVIAASKVFAGDKDIVAYSATVNPLDWSSKDNAGYLPFGLQTYGANPVKGLGLYRGNVIVFNAQGSQVWQVDEDPSLMAKLDAFPLGSEYHHALAPVTNDLFGLTPLGVRTIGIAGGSINLAAGDVGLPVDPLVQAALAQANAASIDPVALYNPNAGQYWLMFKGQPEAGQTLTFVYTMNQLGKIGAWTRYLFPFSVDDWSILGDDLYLRHGDIVSRVTAATESDEQVIDTEVEAVAFDWSVQWPWLDFGALGQTKMMQGFDIIGTGTCRIQFGYDQTNGGSWTPAWELIADSVPGQLLPMPLAAPSLAVRLTFTGSDEVRTSWDALNLHFLPMRNTA